MEAFNILGSVNPDLLILDYDLPDINGLDLLGILPPNIPVVMSTIHTDKAATCYNIDQVADYLVKPYEYTRFLKAVRRAIEKRNRLSGLIQDPAESAPSVAVLPPKKYIYLRTGRVKTRFMLDEIIYAEAFGPFVKLYSLNSVMAINMRMAEIEQELPGDTFIRIHKSYIINSQHLIRLEKSRLQVGSVKLPIGITYRSKTIKFMAQLGIIESDDE